MTILDDQPGPRAELVDPAVTVRFLLAGSAHVTFQSRRTGTRFTYRVQVRQCHPGDVSLGPSHFVAVLTGSDNDGDDGLRYSHGKKSRIAKDAPSAIAFDWVWRTLTGGKMHPELGVWHERKRPEPVIRPVDAMLAEIEKREGVVEPTLVLVVLKAYRSLEATNRAQREIIEKHVETIASLKRTDERMRVQLKAEQKARRRASR
jgi:predicted transcriptional regulator